VKGGLAGSKLVARLQRKRAQCGAAAAGRRGQAVQHALVSSTKEQQVVAKEVKRAMQRTSTKKSKKKSTFGRSNSASSSRVAALCRI